MAAHPTRCDQTSGQPLPGQFEITLPVCDYDLAATLASGQVFRWRQNGDFWDGVVGRHFVRLRQTGSEIHATTPAPVENWSSLHEFLQTEIDLAAVLKAFPADEPMNAAVASCRGLRLLRQDPWECLASFILSSTKQIVQIRQIVALLCERFGEPANGSGDSNPALQPNTRISPLLAAKNNPPR